MTGEKGVAFAEPGGVAVRYKLRSRFTPDRFRAHLLAAVLTQYQ
jgi:hypothetical protein